MAPAECSCTFTNTDSPHFSIPYKNRNSCIFYILVWCGSSQQWHKRQQSCSELYPSAPQFVCRLWLWRSADELWRQPQSPSDKRQRNDRGMGITSFGWPSIEREKVGAGKETDSERVRHIIPLSLAGKRGLLAHGYGCWGHAQAARVRPLSPLKNTAGAVSARFNQGWTADPKL